MQINIKNRVVVSLEVTYISASAKKLKVLEETLENARNEKYNYNFIMNFIKLKDVITEIVKCPECESTVHIVANKSSRMEFSHMFLVPCSSCDWKKVILFIKGVQ